MKTAYKKGNNKYNNTTNNMIITSVIIHPLTIFMVQIYIYKLYSQNIVHFFSFI